MSSRLVGRPSKGRDRAFVIRVASSAADAVISAAQQHNVSLNDVLADVVESHALERPSDFFSDSGQASLPIGEAPRPCRGEWRRFKLRIAQDAADVLARRAAECSISCGPYVAAVIEYELGARADLPRSQAHLEEVPVRISA